jgi:hypothetical protein
MVIRWPKPSWMNDASWAEIKSKTVDHLDELIAGVRQADACPAGTSWCVRHDEDVCWSRSILVGETHIDVAMSPSRSGPALYGLDDFQDAIDLEAARQVLEAIAELLEEVGR